MGVNVLTPQQPILVTGAQVIPAGLSAAWKGTGRVRLHFHDVYNFSQSGGAVSTIALNAAIPANAILTFGGIDVVTSVTGTTGGTIAVGVSNTLVGGTNTSCILGATAIASFTPAELFIASALQASNNASGWVKTTTAGVVTVTIAVHPLTAGSFEIFGDYYVAYSA